MIRNKLVVLGLSGLMVAGLLSGAAISFAQTEEPATEEAAPATEESTAILPERSGGFRLGMDDEALAAALGITVEELNAAELAAYQTAIAAAVEAGTLTQEQADLLLAGRAAQNYLDTDALNATVRAAYADALEAAVAAGDITQAQADALLAQLETQTFNFGFGGHGGRGGHGGGHGGRGGFGLDTLPETTPDTTPDTTADTSLDA